MLFALAVLAIGVVHLVAHNFPAGLIPVPASTPYRHILIYVSGCALAIAGFLILGHIYQYIGAKLSLILWLIILLAVYTPIVIHNYKNPSDWAGFFEVVMMVSGALILVDSSRAAKRKRLKPTVIGQYLFALAMLVFAAEHFMYAQFIASLITPWIPYKLFFAYLTGAAFLAAGISIIIHKYVRLATILLGLMFLAWFFILHLPRVSANSHTEPEWTSLFVVLASSGEAFLIAGSVPKGNRR